MLTKEQRAEIRKDILAGCTLTDGATLELLVSLDEQDAELARLEDLLEKAAGDVVEGQVIAALPAHDEGGDP